MSVSEGWQWTSVGQVAEVESGPAFQSKLFGGPGEGLRLVRGDNIEPGRLRWNRTRTWPEALMSGYEHLLLDRGDIILAMDRPIVAAGLKLARVLPEDVPALLVQRVARIRPREVHPDFLHYALQSQAFADQLRRSFVGTQIPHITLASIRDFRFLMPAMEEQRRIVDILEDHLSRLDAADQVLATSAMRLKSFTRAALEAMTRRSTVDTVPLADLVERIEAGKSFGSASRPAAADEWGIIKVSAMTWGEFRPDENKVVGDTARVDPRYEIRSGDLLVSRANTTEYVGAPVLVGQTRPKLLLSDKSLRLLPRTGWEPEYLLLLLSAPSARTQMSALATGTKDSMRNISQGALLSIQVPRVDQSEQVSIIATARAMTETATALSVAVKNARDHSSALRSSLLASAFSGRLTAGASSADQLKVAARV